MSDKVNMTIEDIEEMMTRLGGPAEDDPRPEAREAAKRALADVFTPEGRARMEHEFRERKEQEKAEEHAQAMAVSLSDVKSRAFARAHRADKAVEANYAFASKHTDLPDIADKFGDRARMEDQAEATHTLIGTIAEVGIRTNRTLSRIDDTLERIAVALETANNMRGDD